MVMLSTLTEVGGEGSTKGFAEEEVIKGVAGGHSSFPKENHLTNLDQVVERAVIWTRRTRQIVC